MWHCNLPFFYTGPPLSLPSTTWCMSHSVYSIMDIVDMVWWAWRRNTFVLHTRIPCPVHAHITAAHFAGHGGPRHPFPYPSCALRPHAPPHNARRTPLPHAPRPHPPTPGFQRLSTPRLHSVLFGAGIHPSSPDLGATRTTRYFSRRCRCGSGLLAHLPLTAAPRGARAWTFLPYCCIAAFVTPNAWASHASP